MNDEVLFTRDDLRTCAQMIADVSEMGLERTIRYLELYYHVRRACELNQEEEPEETEEEPEEEPETGIVQDLSSAAKGRIFKQETKERMQAFLKVHSYKSLAEAAGIEDRKILAIMECKTVPVHIYRKIAEAMDRMEENNND